MSRVLRIASLIALVLAVFGISTRFELIALGLALYVGSTLVD